MAAAWITYILGFVLTIILCFTPTSSLAIVGKSVETTLTYKPVVTKKSRKRIKAAVRKARSARSYDFSHLHSNSHQRNKGFDWVRFSAIFSIVMGSVMMIGAGVLIVLIWPFGMGESEITGIAFVMYTMFLAAIGILIGGLKMLLKGIRALRV